MVFGFIGLRQEELKKESDPKVCKRSGPEFPAVVGAEDTVQRGTIPGGCQAWARAAGTRSRLASRQS